MPFYATQLACGALTPTISVVATIATTSATTISAIAAASTATIISTALYTLIAASLVFA